MGATSFSPEYIERLREDRSILLTALEDLRRNVDVSTINNSKRSTARWDELALRADTVMNRVRRPYPV